MKILILLVLIPAQIFGQIIENSGQVSENETKPILHKCSSNSQSHHSIPDNLTITIRSNSLTKFQTFRLMERQDPLGLGCSNFSTNIRINSSGNQSKFHLNHAGYLRMMGSTNIIDVPPENFCISRVTSELLELNVCSFNCGATNCLEKCCPFGSVLSKKLFGKIECISATENVQMPMLFSFNSHNISEETNELLFPMQKDPKIRESFLETCEDISKVDYLEIDEAEDILPQLSTLEIVGNTGECIDNFFDGNSNSGNGKWKLARVACNEGVGFKFRSTIKSTRHNSLYKCSSDVSESFVQIPESLRMKFKEPFLQYYKASNNYTSLFDFNLVEREPSCGGDTFDVIVSGDNNNTIIGDKMIQLQFTPDGYVAYMATFLVGDQDKTDEIYFSRENFCISRITEDSVSLKLCKSKCSHNEDTNGNNICIPKCCYFGAVMMNTPDGVLCDYINNAPWMPDFYKNKMTNEKVSSVYPQFQYHDDNQIYPWNCSSGSNDFIDFFMHENSDYRVLSDGRILTRKPGNNVSYLSWEEVFTGTSPTEFCIDAYWDGLQPFNPHNTKVAISRCFVNQVKYDEKLALEERAEKVIMSSQILFFLVHLPCAFIYFCVIFIYVLIWEKQNVQGWTVVAFATSQFFVYIFILTMVGATVFGNIADILLHNQRLCVFTGVMHYFFLISTFTWTLVLTYDIWGKLSSMTPTSRTYKGHKRFIGYTGFALGVPTILSIIAIAMEYSYDIDEDQHVIPGFRTGCLIDKNKPFLLYVVLVNCLLFCGNSIFGFLTFKSLWEAKKNVTSLKAKSNSTSGAFDNKVALVGKLMMLMGFVLIFEIFCKYTSLNKVSIWFNVLESYRLFHALGLFWIFVCSDKTTKQLQEKYPQSPLWSIVNSQQSRDTFNSGKSTRFTSSTAVQ